LAEPGGTRPEGGSQVPPVAKAVLDEFERLGFGRWVLVAPGDAGTASAAEVPVTLHDGTVVAVLEPVDERARQIRHPRELDALAGLLAATLDTERRLEAALERAEAAEAASSTDALTGLANARGWWQAARREAARCARANVPGLVVVIDLDELKTVNDHDGHLAGDLLIRVAARTLQRCLRTADVVARIGGDEFAAFAVDFDHQAPSALVQRLRDELFAAGVMASVGAAVHRPGDVIEETFDVADQAMYEVKRRRART